MLVTTLKRPRGIRPRLKIAYVYRAPWEQQHSDPIYWPMMNSVRAGIQLHVRAGIALDAFTVTDWNFILQFADGLVQVEPGF